MKQSNIIDFLIESLTHNISNIEDSRKQRTNLIYSLKDIILHPQGVPRQHLVYFTSRINHG